MVFSYLTGSLDAVTIRIIFLPPVSLQYLLYFDVPSIKT
jgi:hypothetical protein